MVRRSIWTFLLFNLICASFIQQCNAQNVRFTTNSALFTEQMIRKELTIYPPTLLHQYLKEVIVEDGDGFLGRAEVFSNRIVLNSRCDDLKTVLHHEMSSLFLHLIDGSGKPTYEAPILDSLYACFLKLNGDYQYSYRNDIYSNTQIESSLSDKFYLLKYASRDFENDWNVICQFLFTRGNDVVRFIEKNPEKAVSKKIELVISFYTRLDSHFTKDFFRLRS